MFSTCPINRLTSWRDGFNPCTVQLPLRLAWKRKIYKGYAGAPLVSGQRVFVHSCKPPKNSVSEEKLSVFSRDNGEPLWERTFQDIDFFNAYAVMDETVYFSTRQELLALKDNQVLWEIPGFFDMVNLVDDLLVLSGLEHIYVVRAKNGEILQKLEFHHSLGTSCKDGILVVGTPDNQLYGVDLASGKRLWKTDISRQAQFMDDVTKETKAGSGYRWDPVIADGKIVLQTTELTCCFDLHSGELLWEQAYEHSPLNRGWACDQRHLYTFNMKSLICADLATGKPIYTRQLYDKWYREAVPPLVTDNVLFIAGEGVHAYSKDKGELLWEFWPGPRGTQSISAMPVYVDGRLYVSGKDGFLYCFEQGVE